MAWWIWLIIGAGAVVLLGCVAATSWSARRRGRLQQRFGREYERTVAGAGRGDAEAELRERVRRHDALRLQPLDADSATDYARRWYEIQTRFVDAPPIVLGQAQDLVAQLMHDVGYTSDDGFEEELALVSVDHPDAASQVSGDRRLRWRDKEDASTEALRGSFVRYRVLFTALVERPTTEARSKVASVGDQYLWRGRA